MKKCIIILIILFSLTTINVKANTLNNINAVYDEHTNQAIISWQDNEPSFLYDVYINKELYTTTGSTNIIVNLNKNTLYEIRVNKDNEDEDLIGTKVLYTGIVDTLKPTYISLNGIKINYNKINSSGYYIYRSNNNKDYKIIKKITDKNITEYKDWNLSYGTTYYYRVIPYYIYNNKEYIGYNKLTTSGTTFLKTKIYNLYVKQVTYKDNKLTWDKKIGATGYKIYMSKTRHGKYKKIGVTRKNEFYHYNLDCGQVYYYKVKAYKAIGNSDILGEESDIYSRLVRPLTPNLKITVYGNNALKVNYSKIDNITSYQIYRANCEKCDFYKIKTTKDNSFIDYNLKSKKIYYYKVRTKKRVNKKSIYSRYSDVKYETTTERNAKYKLNLKSVYGDNEAYHPSILYFNNGWNGYKYWLGFTPYPDMKTNDLNGDSSKENPHIKVSNDLKNWILPTGTPNPLDIPSINTSDVYNSDVELVYNNDLDRIEAFWRRVENSDIILYMRYTTDGTNWSDKEEIYRTDDRENVLLSPSIIYEDGKYKMWYVSGYKIRYMEFDNLPFDDLKVEKTFNIEANGEKIYPWHLDVIKNKDKYEIVYVGTTTMGSIRRMSLYYTSSANNNNWNKSNKILWPSKEKYAWDNRGIYRSSLVYVNNKYYLFYSASNRDNIKGTSILSGKSIYDLYPVFD